MSITKNELFEWFKLNLADMEYADLHSEWGRQVLSQLLANGLHDKLLRDAKPGR